MIRTDAGHAAAVAKLQEQAHRIEELSARLVKEGLKPEEIERSLDPLLTFQAELADEVTAYERLRSGLFDDVMNLRGLGRVLIGLRISRGISQRDLAAKLGVDESQVSRDERHEYHGITVERASRILDVLNVILRTTTETAMPSPTYRKSPSAKTLSPQLRKAIENDNFAVAA